MCYSSDGKSKSNDEDDTANEVVARISFPLLKSKQSNDDSTAASVGNAKRHEDRETDLTSEGDEEKDEIDKRVVTKGIVSRSKPANIRQRNE